MLLIIWVLLFIAVSFSRVTTVTMMHLTRTSASMAASLAIDNGADVQDVAYADLEKVLLKENQVLSAPAK